MNKTPRVLLFILLNIAVSAVTTLGVLWVWEQAHPHPGVSQANPDSTKHEEIPLTLVTNEQISKTTVPIRIDNEYISVEIRTIVGAGDLSVEYVEIINRGENPADLTSWQLVDENGNTFTFPALLLNSSGAIKIHSRNGSDTVIELFWKSDVSIWQSGETARLLDSTGELINSYTIP